MQLNNLNIAVLGAGRSGRAAARLAIKHGARVCVFDASSSIDGWPEDIPLHTAATEEDGRAFHADMVVISPGIETDSPFVKSFGREGVETIGEMELACRFYHGRIIAITGTNGKTTTTMLIHHILIGAGIDAGLAGNVGRSLAWQVAREPHPVYVVELSSFQLDNMYDFKANIAVLLNITPDHLDRYEYCMQNYVNAKFRILQNMTPRDVFIFWKDDPVISEQLRRISTEARMLPFSEHAEEDSAAYIDAENELIFNTPGTSMSMPRADLALSGLHNVFNSMAAGLSACVLNIRKEDIRRALEDFGGVEHRLEHVAEIGGVEWINDSKATNVNSCWYALEAMTRPTVLILGGKDKGNDYNDILPLVNEKVKAIVAMGKDNSKIVDFFTGKVPVIRDTHSLAEAVKECRELACAGDTVLLSPCCASFDLFFGYEDRGTKFKTAVRQMKKRELEQ